jgi:hypothetical protein
MTLKEWEKFKLWVLEKKKPINGYLNLYPSALKFLKFSGAPDQHLVEYAEKNRDLFIYIGDGFAQLRDDNLFIKIKSYKGLIPYTYIKTMKIYNYNY